MDTEEPPGVQPQFLHQPLRQGSPWEGVWCAQPYTSLDRRGVRTVGDTGFGNGRGRGRHLEILGDAGNI